MWGCCNVSGYQVEPCGISQPPWQISDSEKLSGGQLGRLRLIAMFANPDHFLLLDEPDNHLDHPSRQLLNQVLDDYPGTLILVSQAPNFVAGVGIGKELNLSE